MSLRQAASGTICIVFPFILALLFIFFFSDNTKRFLFLIVSFRYQQRTVLKVSEMAFETFCSLLGKFIRHLSVGVSEVSRIINMFTLDLNM